MRPWNLYQYCLLGIWVCCSYFKVSYGATLYRTDWSVMLLISITQNIVFLSGSQKWTSFSHKIGPLGTNHRLQISLKNTHLTACQAEVVAKLFFIKMHYLSKKFKLIVLRDLTCDDVERWLGMTKSSLSHVQLKHGTVVGHVTRNMSSQLRFFIKYEGLFEMKVSGTGSTRRV